MSRTVRRQSLFVLVFLIVVLLFVTTFRLGVVRGTSMEPTYQNGQVVLVRHRNWLSPPLRRDSIVLLRKDRDVLIKRIYRLPGEEITDPVLLRMADHYAVSDYFEQHTEQTHGGPVTHLTVPEGYIYVLGDNWRVSEDSRVFGPVPLRDVLGTVVDAPPPSLDRLPPAVDFNETDPDAPSVPPSEEHGR